LKPSDKDVVPLCRYHHDKLHQAGVQTFQRDYGVNLGAEMAFYAAASGTEMP
jgi:hypothetical protein